MQKNLLLKLKTKPSPLWVIFEVNFLRHLASAVLTAIFPLYLLHFVHSNAAVGAVLFLGYCAATLSNFYSAHIIEHFKKRKVLLIALMVITMIFALYSMLTHAALIIMLFGMYQFMLALFIVDVSLYIKHYSNFREIAQNIGKLGALGNLGWLVGPILGALIADRFGFEAVFICSSIISLTALFVFFFIRLEHEDIKVVATRPFAANVKRFFKDPNLRRTYFNNAGLGFIYSIWDLLPLLMITIGATIPVIGMTKSLMGVPQSIFEYPIGQMADKQTGERKLFIVGYALLTFFTVLLGLTHDLRSFIIFFFIAAVGSSFLEMTRDSYFFRQMQEKEIELVAVYRTSDTLPYLIGQGLSVIVLSFLPIHWWFTIGGAIGFLFIINAYRLKQLR